MAENPTAYTRLRPVIHDYLADLAKLGPYGRGKSDVMRRFIENGIVKALEAGVLNKKDIRDFGESIEQNDKDDED